jgi:hypothetical protein
VEGEEEQQQQQHKLALEQQQQQQQHKLASEQQQQQHELASEQQQQHELASEQQQQQQHKLVSEQQQQQQHELASEQQMHLIKSKQLRTAMLAWHQQQQQQQLQQHRLQRRGGSSSSGSNSSSCRQQQQPAAAATTAATAVTNTDGKPVRMNKRKRLTERQKAWIGKYHPTVMNEEFIPAWHNLLGKILRLHPGYTVPLSSNPWIDTISSLLDTSDIWKDEPGKKGGKCSVGGPVSDEQLERLASKYVATLHLSHTSMAGQGQQGSSSRG